MVLTVKEAATHFGVSTHTIRRRIADGTLTAERFGPRLLRIHLDDLEASATHVPVAEDHLGVVHTVDGVRVEALMSDSQIVLLIDAPTPRAAVVLAPDQAEKLGRALWEYGRED